MRYTVKPGLYAVGSPAKDSPVLVSANYKMSFDRLRSEIGGLDAWILVLDTRGINVWCAAGKGTFGTDEVVKRVEAVRLGEIVSHRKLILPQLSAPGVAAHEVRKRCGFQVVFGPVRAEDLKSFLEAGMKARPEMRRVRFGLRDRIPLVPIEIVGAAKWAILAGICLMLLSGLGAGGYTFTRTLEVGLAPALLLAAAFAAAALFTPTLLPWLPGRAFSLKGAWIGLLLCAGAGAYAWMHSGFLEGHLSRAGLACMILAATSYIGMNFTGCSTYTSLSGVRKEMRVAVPLQIAGSVAGLWLWIAGRFV
jgi:acetyl-CoA decarbonylase/synthase complex subunit gamma